MKFNKYKCLIVLMLLTNSIYAQNNSNQQKNVFPFTTVFNCDTIRFFNEKLQEVDLTKIKLNNRSVIYLYQDKECILFSTVKNKVTPLAKNINYPIACCSVTSEYNHVPILVRVKICIDIKGPVNNDTIQNHKSILKKNTATCFDGYIYVYGHVTCFSGCAGSSGCFATYMYQGAIFYGVRVGHPDQRADLQYENGIPCGCCPERTCGVDK